MVDYLECPCLAFHVDGTPSVMNEMINRIEKVVHPFNLYIEVGHLTENGRKFWAILGGNKTEEEAKDILTDAQAALKKAGLPEG